MCVCLRTCVCVCVCVCTCRFLPVLKDYPAKYIYEPWTAPLDVQRKANCIIGMCGDMICRRPMPCIHVRTWAVWLSLDWYADSVARTCGRVRGQPQAYAVHHLISFVHAVRPLRLVRGALCACLCAHVCCVCVCVCVCVDRQRLPSPHSGSCSGQQDVYIKNSRSLQGKQVSDGLHVPCAHVCVCMYKLTGLVGSVGEIHQYRSISVQSIFCARVHRCAPIVMCHVVFMCTRP